MYGNYIVALSKSAAGASARLADWRHALAPMSCIVFAVAGLLRPVEHWPLAQGGSAVASEKSIQQTRFFSESKQALADSRWANVRAHPCCSTSMIFNRKIFISCVCNLNGQRNLGHSNSRIE